MGGRIFVSMMVINSKQEQNEAATLATVAAVTSYPLAVGDMLIVTGVVNICGRFVSRLMQLGGNFKSELFVTKQSKIPRIKRL
jgi:hypothetical protein